MSILYVILAIVFFRYGYKLSGYLTIAAAVVAAMIDVLLILRFLLGV